MNGENGKKEKRTKWDVIVISAIVLLTLLLLLLSFVFRKPGNFVVVEVDGVSVGEYSLSEDGIFILNGGTNTLVIDGGKAYLRDSHCPDKSCERIGKIHYVGQSVICLPNRLSVTVKGESGGGVDFVS